MTQAKENAAKWIFAAAAAASVIAVALICVFLFAGGIPGMMKIGVWEFLSGTRWRPGNDIYGILPMIVTSLYVTALAVIFGVVIGLSTAVCLYRFCPRKLVSPVRQMINLLAGIPSVIYGLFGMTVIVPFLRDYLSPTGVGYGILAAAIVLSVMILPTVVSVSLDSLSSVPISYYEGALALGSTEAEATFKIVLPAAKSGVTSGVILAVGRALGETMAVIMVVGGSPEMPKSLFQSVRTLTSNIAMGAMELDENTQEALIASGVVLLVFALLLNISFSFLKQDWSERRKRRGKV